MRTLAQVMAERREELRHDRIYQMQQAMLANSYDETHQDKDSGQDKPLVVERYIPRPVDKELDQLKAQVAYLQNKVTELRAKKKQEEYY